MNNSGRQFKHAVCAFLAIVALVPTARGQTLIQDLGPSPTVGGVRVQCAGTRTYVARITEIAAVGPGQLLLREDFFTLPAFMQIFVYGKECGIVLGGANAAPDQADCYAYSYGRFLGVFEPRTVSEICAYRFARSADWSSMPTPERCAKLPQCYGR